jgi:hypothetical protein
MKKKTKEIKPLPSWLIVSAKDSKLKEAVEKHLAEKLSSPRNVEDRKDA